MRNPCQSGQLPRLQGPGTLRLPPGTAFPVGDQTQILAHVRRVAAGCAEPGLLPSTPQRA
jgi:hypothetical protein